MKLVIVMISLVAALALATTAEAKPPRTTSINATLVGSGCIADLECYDGGQGGSCLCLSTTWNFAGDTNISPPLGSLAFTGSYSDGYFCSEEGADFSCLVPLTYFRGLYLTLAGANGDKLVLGENFSSNTPLLLLAEGHNPVHGAWNVDPARSTGRFTRYTGSGTYTLNYDGSPAPANFTLELAGTLTFG